MSTSEKQLKAPQVMIPFSYYIRNNKDLKHHTATFGYRKKGMLDINVYSEYMLKKEFDSLKAAATWVSEMLNHGERLDNEFIDDGTYWRLKDGV